MAANGAQQAAQQTLISLPPAVWRDAERVTKRPAPSKTRSSKRFVIVRIEQPQLLAAVLVTFVDVR